MIRSTHIKMSKAVITKESQVRDMVDSIQQELRVFAITTK